MWRDLLCCDAALVEDAYSAQKEVAKLRAELALAKSAALADSAATTASGARVVVSRLDGIESKALQVLHTLPPVSKPTIALYNCGV